MLYEAGGVHPDALLKPTPYFSREKNMEIVSRGNLLQSRPFVERRECPPVQGEGEANGVHPDAVGAGSQRLRHLVHVQIAAAPHAHL